MVIVCTLILSSCNKDDNNKDDQGCIKDENFLKQFNSQIMKPIR